MTTVLVTSTLSTDQCLFRVLERARASCPHIAYSPVGTGNVTKTPMGVTESYALVRQTSVGVACRVSRMSIQHGYSRKSDTESSDMGLNY